MQKIIKNIVTLGPIGYIKGGGTIATTCSIPLAYLLSDYRGLQYFVVLFLFLLVMHALPFFSTKDPSEVVMDEMIGFCVAMYGVATYNWCYVVGFILFRFFDIFKVMGVRTCEQLSGAWGVVMDDVLAGIYTNLLLRLCLFMLL